MRLIQVLMLVVISSWLVSGCVQKVNGDGKGDGPCKVIHSYDIGGANEIMKCKFENDTCYIFDGYKMGGISCKFGFGIEGK